MINRTVLVTGGAGFIGSAFVDHAVSRGIKVVVLDKLTYAGRRENLKDAIGTGLCELVVGDICDESVVSWILREKKVDAVAHFAAESHVDRSITGPAQFIETNVAGTFNLLRCSLSYWNASNTERKERFRYLQVSTDEVYGALGDQGKFTEASPYSPHNPYSATKASGDFLTRSWHHTFGLPTLVTNCSNNYGPRQNPEKLIPNLIRSALAGKKMPVYGHGKNVRDWIFVKDHCQGVMLALEKGRPGETYCFGGNSERTSHEVAQAVSAILDECAPLGAGRSYREQIGFVTDRPGHDWRYAIDDTKAQSELGFVRKHRNFEEGLRATVKWYLENRAFLEGAS